MCVTLMGSTSAMSEELRKLEKLEPVSRSFYLEQSFIADGNSLGLWTLQKAAGRVTDSNRGKPAIRAGFENSRGYSRSRSSRGRLSFYLTGTRNLRKRPIDCRRKRSTPRWRETMMRWPKLLKKAKYASFVISHFIVSISGFLQLVSHVIWRELVIGWEIGYN